MRGSSRFSSSIGIGALVSLLVAGASHAAETTGPEAPLAPAQDQPAAGARKPSTVHRDPDGTPYVLRGPNEKQYLSSYNVTWLDGNHVLTPPGVGGFD